jgi:HD superfamily phosphohydrolase
VDVDKLDYINRDCYHLGLKDMNFENSYLIKNAMVIEDEICYPSKYAGKVYDLFNIRYRLYK